MRRVALASIVALLAAAPTTNAATAVSATSGLVAPQPWQTWIDRSLIPLPDWPLNIYFQDCPDGWGACYGGLDEVWIGPSVEPARRQYVFLHELGHWFDEHALNDHDRQVFQRIAGGQGEWEDDSVETFADAFAACARWRRLEDDRTGTITMFAPGRRTYLHVCEWMQVIAARYSGNTRNLGVTVS